MRRASPNCRALLAIILGVLPTVTACHRTSRETPESVTPTAEMPRPFVPGQLAKPLPGEPVSTPWDSGDVGQVAPAAYLPAASLPFAAAAPGQVSEFSFLSISQGSGTARTAWPIDGQTSVVRLAESGVVTVVGTSDPGNEVTAQTLNGTAVTVVPWTNAGGRFQAQFPIDPNRPRVTVRHAPTNRTIEVISPTDAVPAPRITQMFNNISATTAQFVPSDTPAVLEGYLRLAGEEVFDGTELSFPVFRGDGDAQDHGVFVGYARPLQPVRPTQGGRWQAAVELPNAAYLTASNRPAFVRILARSASNNTHRFSTPIPITTKEVQSQEVPEAGDIKISRQKPEQDRQLLTRDDKGIYLTREPEFWVHGIVDRARLAPPQPLTAKDVRVTVLLDGAPLPVDDTDVVIDQATGQWEKRIKVTEDRLYKVSATVVAGKSLRGQEAGPVQVRVRRTGPGVLPLGSPTSLGEIKVSFDEPIKIPASGNFAPANFQLKPVSGAAAISATAIVPAQGGSDQFVEIVTVQFANVPPGVYTFTISANGIEDRLGNKMPEDYTTRLFQSLDPKEIATTRGITGATGKYVTFPEYTEPRPIVDGFNPSDHVETRVSRLYFYRDAHRVAQIVNREAESHNRAAVQMEGQLADKARQMAGQATADRQAKERNAVEAAGRTREAEQELEQAQAQANSAASQAVAASADLKWADDGLRNAPADQDAEAEREVSRLRNVVSQLESVAAASRDKVTRAIARVQDLRQTESRATESWQASIAVEDQAREEQFRREVAAAHEDPDTYAEGKPKSRDPVEQVSISVIGEGLIQLRGPLKGVNVIRTMINQIDAPVGQVRVGVHTVQINGERGDRMEVVAGQIQRYIDHSRFLTLQSAEMLRRAIVQVAAQKAMEVNSLPGMMPQERDRKYLDAFFGDDFLRELEVMDSEFLKSGNKLLSLHSMDSTSLASGLFLMSLAKNSTRLQVLETFEGMMAGELPLAEQSYYEAGLTCEGGRQCRGCNRCRDRKGEQFQLLSANARFQSLRGFFNADLGADETMSPLQREFVRLAQIFKSRLIVELELRQRIMERAVIEERLGDRKKELQLAKDKEDAAQTLLEDSRAAMREAQRTVLHGVQQVQAEAEAKVRQTEEVRLALTSAGKVIENLLLQFEYSFAKPFLEGLDIKPAEDKPLSMRQVAAEVSQHAARIRHTDEGTKEKAERSEDLAKKIREVSDDGWDRILRTPIKTTMEDASDGLGARVRNYRNDIVSLQKFLDPGFEDSPSQDIKVPLCWKNKSIVVTVVRSRVHVRKEDQSLFEPELKVAVDAGAKARDLLGAFRLPEGQQHDLDRANATLASISEIHRKATRGEDVPYILEAIYQGYTMMGIYHSLAAQVSGKAQSLGCEMAEIVAGLSEPTPEVVDLSKRWIRIRKDLDGSLADHYREWVDTLLKPATDAFSMLGEAHLQYQFAAEEAELARRPLDHKKFLDMLVDDMEDKYIELLEGTRAHTANIDAYIKRLITSLDDDFNTQFYYPTFRYVRQASRAWDVQLGQIETTTILANNRDFAKVSPQATMEFDLPKRDILISEAINGAKATIDDIGALAQDPTFLSLAKLKSGQPTSSPAFGATGGLSTVRNVLPGLESATAENVLGQHGPGGTQFGAAMEALIPDPAIYKFETGTGYEIRPVIQPDGQAVVFDFNYMYTTNIREPVRADEKHLGRVKRHFIDTDVQLSNFELREVSRYTVALKAARTSRGVPLLEDIPVVGVLWRPLPSDESSLQQNIILGQATIFPTLFDLMGLRWAPAVADLDSLRLVNDEFIVRNRHRALINRVFDHSSSEVDKFLRVPESERRMDLYRSQETIPSVHPNGYSGPGANLRDSQLQEGYSPTNRPQTQFVPGQSAESSPLRPQRLLLQPQVAPALDAPHGGGDSGPGSLECPLPPSSERPESVPAPSPDINSGASSRRSADGGGVSRTSYLQPLSRSTLPQLASPPRSREAPLLLRQMELRRLPRVDGNIRSN